MTGKQKKITMKDISEELQTVKEQVKEIPFLKQTIVKLLEIVEKLKPQEDPVVTKFKNLSAENVTTHPGPGNS